MRQVWKPLAWAEMPRMACMPTGPADHLLVPAAEPVGPGDVERDLLLEGRMRQLGGDAADGGGGDARLLLAASRAHSSADRKRSARSWNTGTASRPSARRKVPDSAGRQIGAKRAASLPDVLS